MIDRRALLAAGVALPALAVLARLTVKSGFAGASTSSDKAGVKMTATDTTTTDTAIGFRNLSEAEWKKRLTPEQFYVLRKHGTERAGTSPLNKEKRDGTFACAGCDLTLFDSATKFESGTGWPSFYQPLPGAVEETTDRSFFMIRTEVNCSRCNGHLGHVFNDGPKPTGLRYCMNGVAMKFEPKASSSS
jgi:peptide-methionine (R)-S-oxide reductase